MKKDERTKRIHVNPSGRMCFRPPAVKRMGRPANMAVTVVIRLVPTAEASDTTPRVKKGTDGEPYISTTLCLKKLGVKLLKKGYSPVVEWYGDNGFEFQLPDFS